MTISNDVNLLMDKYWKWLKESTEQHEIGSDCVAITTPFLDHHNDNYVIYVIRKNNQYVLTDDEYVLSDLQISGCDISSGKRQEYVDTLIRSYGIDRHGNSLCITCNEDEFPARKHDLIQAMMALGDLFYTSKSNIISMFFEEVSEWLMKSKVPSVAGTNLKGRTYNHHIDFILPDKEINGPKRILQIMDKPGRDKVANLLLMKTDISEKTEIFVLINDSNAGKRSLDLVQKATSENGITPIMWSKREEFVPQLI